MFTRTETFRYVSRPMDTRVKKDHDIHDHRSLMGMCVQKDISNHRSLMGTCVQKDILFRMDICFSQDFYFSIGDHIYRVLVVSEEIQNGERERQTDQTLSSSLSRDQRPRDLPPHETK